MIYFRVLFAFGVQVLLEKDEDDEGTSLMVLTAHQKECKIKVSMGYDDEELRDSLFESFTKSDAESLLKEYL